MFQINQCVMSIFEPLLSTGSGSCISRTKLCVPAGTCDHFSSGDGAVAPRTTGGALLTSSSHESIERIPWF